MFNPYLQSDLRDVKAQGASVGDIRDYQGSKFRWDGIQWTKEGGGASFSGSNPQSYIDAAVEAFKKANEPAIQSFQSQIPEVQQKFATERERLTKKIEPLKERYDNLISSIKGNQQVAENRQTVATSNELGRRGILADSGVAEQTMTDALNPITQQYTTLAKDAGIAREEDLQNLEGLISDTTTSEVDALRAIKQAIAQLQSGAATSGISTGLNLFSTDRAREDQLKLNALLQEQQRLENEFREKQFNEGVRQFNVSEGRLGQASSGGIESLLSMLGIGNITGGGAQGKYIPEIGKSVVGYLPDGRALYSDGTAGWTHGIKNN